MSAFDQALQAPLLTLTERNGNDSSNRGHRRSGSDESTASTISTASSSLPPRRNKSNRSSSSKSSKSSKRDRYPTKGRGSRKPINTIQGPPKECFDPSLNLAFDYNNNNDYYDERHLLTSEELQKLESGAIDYNVAIAQERHGEISSLTLDMEQIRTIQTDLAGIIDDQQVGIDDIEYSLTMTNSRVDKGVNQLEEASELQKKRQRNEKIIVIIAAACVIGILLFWYSFLRLK